MTDPAILSNRYGVVPSTDPMRLEAFAMLVQAGVLVEVDEHTLVDVVFDGVSSQNSVFVEVETLDGAGVRAGEWMERDDGYWVLRMLVVLPRPDQFGGTP